MNDRTPMQVTIELAATEHIEGTVRSGTRPAISFSGWSELFAVLLTITADVDKHPTTPPPQSDSGWTCEILVGVARDRQPGGSSLAEGGFSVPTYLIQLAYTADAWAAMVNQPQNRLEAVRPIVEKLGGRFEHAWLAFGEYDIVGVVELPENTDAAAFSMAVAAGGAVKAFKTTPLLSVEEGVEAMRKAQGAGYRRPGG
jgi:uncharacterized protein with GYD domain